MCVFLELTSFPPQSHCSCCFIACNLLTPAPQVAGFFSSFKFTLSCHIRKAFSEPFPVILTSHFYNYYPVFHPSGHTGPGMAGALAMQCLLPEIKCVWFFHTIIDSSTLFNSSTLTGCSMIQSYSDNKLPRFSVKYHRFKGLVPQNFPASAISSRSWGPSILLTDWQ